MAHGMTTLASPSFTCARCAACAFGLVAFASLLACDKSPFEAERALPVDPPPAASTAKRMELDAGFAIERADPPAPAGDLKEDVTRFSTLDECVAQHAVIDPLVSDAVRAIGYDTLLRDACRILQAIKVKDTSPCLAITASSLQSRCQSLVAMAVRDPEKCPWYSASEKQLGRDPDCLAVATHDPRSCAAGLESTHATCEALSSGDPSRCASATGDEHATCARDMERERSLLAVDHDALETKPPRAHLEIHGAGATKDPPATELDLSSNVAGGAVIASAVLGGANIELARDLEMTLRLPSRADRSHLAATVAFESGAPKLVKLALSIPKVGELSCPSPHCALILTMPQADQKRGSPLSATMEGTIETPGATYQVKLQIDTYVRDVVGRAAFYGAR
jgi:hypothetical protein